MHRRRGVAGQKCIRVVVPHHPPVGGLDDARRQRADESPVGVVEVGGSSVAGVSGPRAPSSQPRPTPEISQSTKPRWQNFAECRRPWRLNRQLKFCRIRYRRLSAKLHTAEAVRQRRRIATTTKENRVKRSVTVAAAATAIVVVGLSGCSSDKSSTSSGGRRTQPPRPRASGSSVAKVTIDGKDQNVQGTVACSSAAGSVNIAIGGAQTGIGVVLTDASPPVGEVGRAGQCQRGDARLHPGRRRRATPARPRTAASTRSAGPRPGWTWPTRCSP